jgi:PiT family inorganic phosphate transporter
MTAESASAAVILLSSHFGYSLSTTHVATGSILGTGVGKKGAEVRWSVAGRMATAWVITLPAAGLVGAVSYYIANGLGGSAGVAIMFVVLVAAAVAFFAGSRKTKVTSSNVNDEWTGTVAPSQSTPLATAAA